MSFFNLNRGSSSAPTAPGAAQPESMDVIRKRAKHRLIGAAVLVLVGVVGFPLLFDAQPRPIAVDMPIEIPGKNTVKPLTLPGKPDAVAPAPAKPDTVAAAPAKAEPKASASGKTDKVAAAASLDSQEEIVSDKKPVAPAVASPAAIKKEADKVAKAEIKAPTKPEVKADVKPEAKVDAKPAAKTDDGARAKALLDGQGTAAVAAPTAAAGSERMIVQVGAFADADKAKEVRQKLERAGLKTYTQVAETKDGQRTRVRVGPFASRADAEKAASKIKSLDLPASILTL